MLDVKNKKDINEANLFLKKFRHQNCSLTPTKISAFEQQKISSESVPTAPSTARITTFCRTPFCTISEGRVTYTNISKVRYTNEAYIMPQQSMIPYKLYRLLSN